MIRIGDFQIHIINESTILADAGGPFGLVPRALYMKYKQPDENNRIPMVHQCLLVQVGGKNIVVDTGNGTKLPPQLAAFMNLTHPDGDLLDGLARHGVQPADVHLVINTHLHSDHCGDNTRLNASGEIVPTFPNAEYVVQRLEAADATYPNERTRGTYYAHNFEPLIKSGQMRLFSGDTELMPGLRTVVTPGHTRAHQSVIFEADGKAAMYVCDLASFAVHFAKLAWMTSYDVEPLITLETKRHWQQWALKHDARLIFIHDPDIPVGRLVGTGDKFEVVPAEMD
jgi:glyoxylase-like metal-dependent hydrolase (beta-lactamase superfamily II)